MVRKPEQLSKSVYSSESGEGRKVLPAALGAGQSRQGTIQRK